MRRDICTRCGSYAINPHLHGRRPGYREDLCDVCYWRAVAEELRTQFDEQHSSISEELDLNEVETPGEAATLLHRYLQEHHDAKEAILMDPDASADAGLGACWRVMWEGGPFEWAVNVSLGQSIYAHTVVGRCPEVLCLDNEHWIMEPYYSFDVGFYPTTKKGTQ